VFPIYQKCDELALQLMERNEVVTTFRDAYLRDVVSIKYHLEKIGEIKFPEEDKHNVPEMYSLSAIPSPDLRSLVEKAKQAEHPTSLQLQETLLYVGYSLLLWIGLVSLEYVFLAGRNY
jgi:hypothetical protein